MGVTLEQILNELEKPENEGEIRHLVHLKHLVNLDELKQMKGVTGFFTKIGLGLAKKHMDALIILSNCKTSADITAFKQTEHYKKAKSVDLGDKIDLNDLSQLEELQDLKGKFGM